MANMFDKAAQKDVQDKKRVTEANAITADNSSPKTSYSKDRYEGVKPFMLKLPPELHKSLKMQSVLEETEMNAIIVKALVEYLSV